MSKIEIERFKDSLDDPLLIFKVGVLGCTPLELMGELADGYDATCVSSDEVRWDLVGERRDRGISPTKARRVNTDLLRERVAEGVRTALAEGQDVALDMFCNTAKTRRMPIDLARDAGARTIALSFNTPFSLVKQRVRQWTREDAFFIPVSEWEVRPMTAAQRMMSHVERPVELEGIDHVFDLSGIGDTGVILDRYEAALDSAGLLDRFEDLED